MQKIVDYKLVVGKDYHEVVERVYQLIEEGFEPQGSIQIRQYKTLDITEFIQPMVKKTPYKDLVYATKGDKIYVHIKEFDHSATDSEFKELIINNDNKISIIKKDFRAKNYGK